MKIVVGIILAASLACLIALSPNCSTSKWVQLSHGGEQHTIALHEDGSIWGWGSNLYGQVGVGKADEVVNAPTQIGADKDWAYIGVGWYHSFAIKKDGSLWAWGNNLYGQLGDGTDEKRNAPVRIGESKDWKFVEGGDHHSVAIKTDGTLWAWGDNKGNQLLKDQEEVVKAPIQIGTDNNWIQVSPGNGFNLAIQKDLSLWGWGSNTRWQLGLGEEKDPELKSEPVKISSEKWKSVSAGDDDSVGIKEDGSLYFWGCGFMLGCDESVKVPTKQGDSKWKDFMAFEYVGVGIKEDGTLWAIGKNEHGQLGNAEMKENWNKEEWDKLTQVGTESDWEDVKGGETFVLGIKKTTRQVFSWGKNTQGELGFGTSSDNEYFLKPDVCGANSICHDDKCSVCPKGELKTGLTCEKCDPTCAECSETKTKCTACPTGKVLNVDEHVCQEACDANCETCETTTTRCKTCKNKNEFVSDEFKCETCDANCLTCSGSADKCLTCPEGKVVRDDKCKVPCDASCKTCADDDGKKCTSCPDGQFLNSENAQCVKCDASCKNCVTTATTCTACPDTHNLEKDKCVAKPADQKPEKPTDSDTGSSFPWWIVIVIGSVALVGFGAYYFGYRRMKAKELSDRLTDQELSI